MANENVNDNSTAYGVADFYKKAQNSIYIYMCTRVDQIYIEDCLEAARKMEMIEHRGNAYAFKGELYDETFYFHMCVLESGTIKTRITNTPEIPEDYLN